MININICGKIRHYNKSFYYRLMIKITKNLINKKANGKSINSPSALIFKLFNQLLNN